MALNRPRKSPCSRYNYGVCSRGATLHDPREIPRFLYGEYDAERIQGKQRIPADRRPAAGYNAARIGARRGVEGPDLAGCHRVGEDSHHGPRHRKGRESALVIAHNKTLAAQLA